MKNSNPGIVRIEVKDQGSDDYPAFWGIVEIKGALYARHPTPGFGRFGD